MSTAVYTSVVPVPRAELAAWHARPGALERMLPPWDATEVVSRSGDLAAGEVRLRVPVGPLSLGWTATHEGGVPGEWFRDRQSDGPFRSFVHTHRFADDPAGARLSDELEWTSAAPDWALRPRLDRTFRFRHVRLAEDLRRHHGVRPRRIVVAGASGLVGQELVAFLGGGGHRVDRLVRRAAGPGEIAWDPDAGTLDAAALEGADAVIVLSGASVATRWTDAARAEIVRSRVATTGLVARTLAGLSRPPPVLIVASAVGWYGDHRGAPLDEASAPGTAGFLHEVCAAWEAAADPARAAGIRVVHPRIGVVLTPRGGALGQLLLPARLGLGGPLGDGTQPFPWIAMDDLVHLLHWALDAPVSGPLNAVAPTRVDQRGFAATLGEVLGRPAGLPLPAAAVKLGFGRMGEEVLLQGAVLDPRVAREGGFRWSFPELAPALRFLLGVDPAA